MQAGPESHGYNPKMELNGMMSVMEKTGSVKDVARAGAEDWATFQQEFAEKMLADALIPYSYKVVNNRWTNKGRTLEDFSVDGDRTDRVLRAESMMMSNPQIKQVVVGSEDLGYGRSYAYLFSRDSSDPNKINALAIEHQGTVHEFKNFMKGLMDKKDAHLNEFSLSDPFAFKEDKQLDLTDVFHAATNSFRSPQRQNEMSTYLTRIKRDTTDFDGLKERQNQKIDKLSRKIEEQIHKNDNLRAGLAQTAYAMNVLAQQAYEGGYLDMNGAADRRFKGKQKSFYQETVDQNAIHQHIHESPTLLAAFVKKNEEVKRQNNKNMVSPSFVEKNHQNNSEKKSDKKERKKKDVKDIIEPIIPALLFIISEVVQSDTEASEFYPSSIIQTPELQNGPDQTKRENTNVVIETVTPLVPAILGINSILAIIQEPEGEKQPPFGEFLASSVLASHEQSQEGNTIDQFIMLLFEPNAEKESKDSSVSYTQYEAVQKAEQMSIDITKLFNPSNLLENDTFAALEKQEKKEEFIKRLQETISFVLFSSRDTDGKGLDSLTVNERKQVITDGETIVHVVKLLVQNSETIIPANDETWGEIKSRLSFYLSAYESKNTSQEMKTILAALMLYEGKQNKKQFQTVFNQLPVFGDSSLLTFELNNFVLRLEQILSEQFGISVQLDMKDPRFCEAMYALLCFLMTHKRNSEVNENMLEGDDLIGYQLERLQKNASLPLLISFAKKGVIYQYQLGPNFMPFLLA